MKCKNCGHSPVYLGNKCPNCSKEVVKDVKVRGKDTSSTNSCVKKKILVGNLSNTDIKNIENLTDKLKKAKTSNDKFENYVKLVTFIEELACKVDFDSVDDIEDLVITLEYDSAKRISDFFTKILPQIDKSDDNFISLISEKKKNIDDVIEKYNTVLKQNEELISVEKRLKKENENLSKIKKNIEELKKIEKNIKENDINKLILQTNNISKNITVNIEKQVVNLKENANEILKISKIHNKSNSDILNALNETLDNMDTSKSLDRNLLNLADDVIYDIKKLNKKLKEYDVLLKNNI